MSGTTNIPGVCVIMKRKGKMLTVLREHTGFQDGNYGLPGGHVEDNETFRAAACREVLEEVGVVVRPEDLQYRLTVHRKAAKDIRIDVYFEVSAWEGEPTNMEPERHAKIEWLDEGAIPPNLTDYMKSGLECIASNTFYGEFGWE